MTCYPDVAPFQGTSFTSVCVNSIRDYINTLPKNYTAEVAFRESEGENCTNYQGAQDFNICKLWQSQEQFSGQQILTETNVILDSMNTCFPSPNAPSDATWRFYTTCTAESMSSQRECSADALTAKVWRHAKDRATNSTRASMRHIFAIISSSMDVVAPASALQPTFLLPYLAMVVLALSFGNL